MLQRLRHLWLKVHLYLGLTVGLLFALTGLTGSLIVFDHALDEQLNAEMLLTRNTGPRKSLAEIVLAAEASGLAPGRGTSVVYPRVENGTFAVYFKPAGANAAEAPIPEVFVDPVTGEALGARIRGSGLMETIYRLHSSLWSGKTGQAIQGGMAALVLISIGTGLILWWPLRRAGWRTAVGIRRRKLNFDLHKVGGVFFTPVLFLIAFTGVHLAWPAVVRPVVTAFLPETKLPQKVKSLPPASRGPGLGPDEAMEVAERTMPECRPMMLELPAGKEDSYRAFVRQVGEVGELRGVGRVWVDRYSGEVLATRDWTRFTAADTYLRVQLALHSGDAFGMAGRWLLCVSGLVPALLYGTGFALWWRKQVSRRRQLARARQIEPAGRANEAHSIVVRQPG